MNHNTIKVLDHGFVTLRNIAGPTRRADCEFDADDTDPANAARMSFDMTDSGRTRAEDLRLSRYLMKNRHTSPFEQVQVWMEMKMPIFAARQFVRHRTARLNEISGRYITLPAEWYIPEVVGGKAANAKQGQEDNLSQEVQERFKRDLHGHCASGYAAYLQNIADGIAPEHARMQLSLNHYTHWLWNNDMHNIMHCLMLRDHSHAQKEAEAYAQSMDKLIRRVLPATMELYDSYRRMPVPMTREQAIEKLRAEAMKHAPNHHYLLAEHPLHEGWLPHEWTIQAVLAAANKA